MPLSLDIDQIDRHPPAADRAPHGFSLLELLVGVTILIVMVVFLSQMIVYSQDVWHMAESRKEQLQAERAITDYIGRELQAALLPINRPSQTDLQFVVNPASVSSTYRNRDAIFWQMPLASDATMGDVAEVGYFVRWDESDASNPRSLLGRFYVNPTSADYLIHTSPDAWITDAVLNSVAPAVRTDTDSSYMGLFVENVIGLWVQCLDSSGQVITMNDTGVAFAGATYDSRQGYTDSEGTVRTRGALPVAVKLSLVMLNSRTAARIGAQEHSAIMELTSDPSMRDSSDFITKAASVPGLSKISAGIRAYQTHIYLQTSR